METIMNRAIRSLLRPILASAAFAFVALAASPALAADAAGAPKDTPGAGNKGVFITGKVGGIVPFGGLGPNVIGGIDVGYALDMGLAFGVAADYAAPKKHGTETDPRIAGGSYSWHLTEQELQIMPFVMYRVKSLGSLVPYFGIGPRIYFLKSTVRSNEGTPSFQETTEQSGKIGFGVPIGLEVHAGPGAAIAELLLQYGGIDHTATGNSNTGAASLALGYRLMF
jgi:opacity protein-like surface antigen